MNQDFVTWFFAKHWFIALFLFPEIAFAWGVWQKWWLYSIFAAIQVLSKSYVQNNSYVVLKKIYRDLVQ